MSLDQNVEHGSHLKYCKINEDNMQSDIEHYWVAEGFVFYLIPKRSGIDDPDEAIIYDTKSRSNAPRKILDMYPGFIVYNIGVTDYSQWYYFRFRK